MDSELGSVEVKVLSKSDEQLGINVGQLVRLILPDVLPEFQRVCTNHYSNTNLVIS